MEISINNLRKRLVLIITDIYAVIGIKMMYIRNLISKLEISVRRLIKRLVAIIEDICAIWGTIFMIAEAALVIFGYNGIFEFYRSYFLWILGTIAGACIWKNWDHLKYTVKIIDSPDVTITLQVCDVLNNKGAIIIPTNTTFDTKMEDEFISKGSIQGQYQMKYFENRLQDLDKKIDDGLNEKKYIMLNDRRATKKKRYMIGTVCKIDEKDRKAYFIADSDINIKGIPTNVDASNIASALVSLWDSLVVEGNHEPYSIPLLGTGKARAKDMSRDEAVRQIILTFLAATKEHKVTENLTICIHPKDYNKVNWDDLCEFLKYNSKYANRRPLLSKPSGSAEITPSVVKLKDEEIEEDMFDEMPANIISHKLQESDLSEKEKMMMSILRGNKMKKSDIAAAMGLPMNTTTIMLRKLQAGGLIQVKGVAKNVIYEVLS